MRVESGSGNELDTGEEHSVVPERLSRALSDRYRIEAGGRQGRDGYGLPRAGHQARLVAVDLETSPALRVAGRRSTAGFWATGVAATTGDVLDYDLSRDGRTFAAMTPVRADTRVFVAYNWVEEMRREWRAGSKK